MRKGNAFKNIRNFLAMWAGLLVSIFLGIEIYKMLETFILNANMAFEVATEAWIVIAAMVVSVIFVLVTNCLERRKKQ